MFSYIARELAELGKILYEALHIRDRVELLRSLLLGCELLNVVLCILAEISEVEIHVLFEKGVLILADEDFLGRVNKTPLII